VKLVRVELSLAADSDILLAALHYANVSDAVLDKFYKALFAAQQHIARYPSSGLNRYAYEVSIPNLRHWPLNGFPYALFYLEHSAHCTVIRCAHMSSNIPSNLQTAQPTLH
jgi:toxin ParE1/3/4